RRSWTTWGPTASTPWSWSWPSRRSSASRSPTRTPRRSRASRKPWTTSRSTRTRARSSRLAGTRLAAERRVVVTGVGLVSALGIGTAETWQGLLAGRSGVAPITLFDASQHSTRFAAEIKGFDPLLWVEKKEVKKMDRFIQFAVAAADIALRDSGLTIAGAEAEEIGVYIGSGIGGFATIEREHRTLLEEGPRR